MKILVTGAAGFIGFHLSQSLAKRNYTVIGLDNLNDYYDVRLKLARLNELGVSTDVPVQKNKKLKGFENFSFYKTDLCEESYLKKLFKTERFDVVIHLAAQAGVRYSITNPDAYIESNINGFYNIIKNCELNKINHLIYASSSSVYGNSKTTPFSTSEPVNEPISLYAATKKSNELLAHVFSHIYNLKTTGLRFFTVYGPWGRPDMAYYKFVKAILTNAKIDVYNNGKLERDFTYIDDIVEGIIRILEKGFISTSENQNYVLYNIGAGNPIKLMDFIYVIEKHLDKRAVINMLPMQQGDVYQTWADIADLVDNYNYTPKTELDTGIKKFIDWYLKAEINILENK